MKKLKFLIKYGLKKRVGRKAFLIANIIIMFLLVIVVNLPSIIKLFSSDEEEVTNIYIDVINETSNATFSTDLSDLMNAPFNGYIFYVINEKDNSTFDKDLFWENDLVDVTFKITGDLSNPTVTIYSKYPDMNRQFENYLELQIINSQIASYERPNFIQEFSPDFEDPETGMMIGSITSILILPIFMLITMATGFVGVDIIEEKSTKAIETIIASVPAKIHFISKIVSSILFVIIQSILIFIYGVIAQLIGSSISTIDQINLPVGQESLLAFLSELLPNWPQILMFALLFMIFGTLFYLVIAALFASMAVTQEDYQQFQSPLMLTLVVGFYIGIFAPMANGMGLLKVMSFVPIFSPIVAPIAYASNVLTNFEAFMALLVVILFLIIAIYVVSPIYKVAILNYDQTKFFKRIKDNIKKAFVKKAK